LTDVDKIRKNIDEDSALKDTFKTGDVLASVGTKEGKILVYRVSSSSHNKLF